MKCNSIAIATIAILSAIGSAACTSELVAPPAADWSRSQSATTQSSDPGWGEISGILGRAGTMSEQVYVVRVPRDDLDVRIEGMDVPTAAGLESTFWFYRCPCGKMNVVGEFILADYEANDVIDALRSGMLKVASASAVLLFEKPRLTSIRFQGEGEAAALAKTIREALRWTSKERMAPRKID